VTVGAGMVSLVSFGMVGGIVVGVFWVMMDARTAGTRSNSIGVHDRLFNKIPR
jgi:hypothetical protein